MGSATPLGRAGHHLHWPRCGPHLDVV